LISPFIAGLCAPVVEHLQPLDFSGHNADFSLQLVFEFLPNAPLPQRNSRTKDDFLLVRIHPLTEVF
jgi:hypothetical protein